MTEELKTQERGLAPAEARVLRSENIRLMAEATRALQDRGFAERRLDIMEKLHGDVFTLIGLYKERHEQLAKRNNELTAENTRLKSVIYEKCASCGNRESAIYARTSEKGMLCQECYQTFYAR